MILAARLDVAQSRLMLHKRVEIRDASGCESPEYMMLTYPKEHLPRNAAKRTA